MSDKKLLNENTIRRFMTLAKVDRLPDNFINEKKKKEELEEASYMEEEELEEGSYSMEEEEMEEGMGYSMEEDEEFEEGMGYSMEEDEYSEGHGHMHEQAEEEEDVELDLGDDEGEEDAGMDAGEEMGEADVSLTEEEAELLISLGERRKEAMDKEEEEGAGMTDPYAPMSVPADEEGEEGEEDEEMADMEPEEDEEEIVQEILKRVTSRLVREKRISR